MKKIHFSEVARFSCEILAKREEDGIEIPYKEQEEHYNLKISGDFITHYISRDTETLPNGDVKFTVISIKQKVSKSHKSLICKCGKKILFLGFPAYLEEIIKEGKTNGFLTIGGESKRSPVQYFKTRDLQKEYLNNLLKERK